VQANISNCITLCHFSKFINYLTAFFLIYITDAVVINITANKTIIVLLSDVCGVVAAFVVVVAVVAAEVSPAATCVTEVKPVARGIRSFLSLAVEVPDAPAAVIEVKALKVPPLIVSE
jgi:hypothetical protein